MINSKKKGCVGERELAKLFRDFGFSARRGQQFKGTPDSPDVLVEELPDFHFECKRTERGDPYVWLQQADEDRSSEQKPVVAHRKNNKPWVAIMYLPDLLALLSEVIELRKSS